MRILFDKNVPVGVRGFLTGHELHKGQRWRVGKALQGERVRIEQVDQRLLVFYCTTLIVERWITNPLPVPQV